jgi:hypothetical protein
MYPYLSSTGNAASVIQITHQCDWNATCVWELRTFAKLGDGPTSERSNPATIVTLSAPHPKKWWVNRGGRVKDCRNGVR